MLITFQSPATPDVVMLRELAQYLLGLVGKRLDSRGVILHDELPGAIRRLEAAILTERDGRRNAARRSAIEGLDLFAMALPDVPLCKGGSERLGVHLTDIRLEQASAIEFAEDAHDAACPVNILDMNVGNGWCDLAEDRHLAREAIDVLHGKIEPRLVRCRQQMQDSVGRAAHRDVE